MNRIITIALLVLVSLSACSREESAEPVTESIEVSTYTLKPEAVAPVTTYASRIYAFENAEIVARIEARVLQRHVEGGEEVARGALLISLDPTDAELLLTQAEAGLATARTELAEAERNFARGEKLAETGAIAAIEMDELTTDLEAARAQLQTATASLEHARVQVGYTRVTAPIDGIVGLVNVSVGDLVGPTSAPVATIIRQDTVLVDIEVGEADAQTYAQRMARGEELDFLFELELANGSMYDVPGTLFSTANAANPATGTITARIAYDNPDDILIPGQSVRVHLSEAPGAGRLAVPAAAVQQDQRGSYVMVVEAGNTVARRYVDLGQQVESWWLVDDGVTAGEIVVTQGLQKISAGSVVSIASPE